MSNPKSSVLGNFNRPELLEKIVSEIKSDKSRIIEVVGSSGSGKSHLYHNLKKYLQEKDAEFIDLHPFVFRFNQLKEIMAHLVNITHDEFIEFAEQADENSIKTKYDFFYFLTEKIREKHDFKPRIFIIDNFDLYDQYSIDFIQYIVQYAKESNIKFVCFTQKATFIFSKKIKIDYLKIEEIERILSDYIEDEKEVHTAAEIMENISGGNIYLIENVLNRFIESKKEQLDLNNFLDTRLNVEEIYKKKVDSLSELEKNILFSVFVLEKSATKKYLKNHFKDVDFDEKYQKMLDEKLLYEKDNYIKVNKLLSCKKYFDNLAKNKKKKLYKSLKEYLDFHNPREASKYLYEVNVYDKKIFDSIIDYLETVNDHENLQKIYNFILEHIKNDKRKVKVFKRLGVIYKTLNKIESAAEVFRQSLRISSENSLPREEIIFLLSETLNSINSPSFALEIIKKYSPKTISNYWKTKLILLKTQILLDLEKIEEAYKEVDEIIGAARDIKDEKARNSLLAERKKMLAKINFYMNELSKAEADLWDAEKLYSKVKDFKGLAAIYNNLGVLLMSRAEWKDAEKMYLKSLKHEQERYSLNGISVCYNNLGGLMSDMGDHERSLHYLEKALEIQSLVNDRYKITFIYNNIGVTCMENAMFKKAEESFNKALEISLTFNLFRNIVYSYYNLGALYFKTGKWAKAIEFYERSIEKSKENNFLEGLCKAYNNLGELYEKRGEYNLAYDLYFKGLEILPDVNDKFLKAELYGNLGSVLTRLHKYGEAYPYLVESYDYFKSLDAKNKIIEANQKYAYYFLQTRNKESASYYIKSAIRLSKETKNEFELGRSYYIQSLLESSNLQKAKKSLKKAIELFVKTKNNFELALANYQYAKILSQEEKWEQALHILSENKKIINEFDSISLLEKNDFLINKISKAHSAELKESKYHETLLNKFYKITKRLNSINNFDNLLNAALEELLDLSEADGGILCLYHSYSREDEWEYRIGKNFSRTDDAYETIDSVIKRSYEEDKSFDYQQPHFAPVFNHIITFPLRIRNKIQGIILLFCKHGSNYFTKRVINLVSALCNQIIVTVENLKQSNLEKSHAIIREELLSKKNYTNIIGKSPKIERIFKLIDKIKNAPTTVLIEGPSGTGKELIARAIHFNSNRKNKKFVAQYCGALPETLLESELFGHVKGAFTGAAYDKKGLFEIADGGTFFLDEIGDISLSTQAKLLRFLQEGEIKRVGSTQTTKVDVRVICATNIPLKDKVDNGEFRLDLYYRLNVIRIEVPSLKERKSDIPLLAIHFLDKYNRKIGKTIKGITDEAMKYLKKCGWPGNIRQLENEIERAVTLAEDKTFIRPSDLSEEIFKYSEHKQTLDLLDDVALKSAVEKLEIRMIKDALEKNNWNQTRAAKQLQLSRQGLIKKMKRYKIEKPKDN